MRRRAALLVIVLAAAAPASAAPDIAEEAGIDFEHEISHAGPGKRQFAFYEATAGGVCWGDFDEDGHPDALFTNFPGTHGAGARLYRNLGPAGDYRFEDVTAGVGLGVVGVGQGCAWGDYDNDGWSDLYLTFVVTPHAPRPNVLLRNLGGTAFEDVTQRARASGASTGAHSEPCNPILETGDGSLERCWSTAPAWLDYDNDGDLDLYVAGYAQFPFSSCQREFDANPIYCLGQANRLLRNDGGIFTDVAAMAGVATNGGGTLGRSLGVMAADVDLDGWIDLWVANDMDAGALFMNNRDGTFRNVAGDWAVDNHGLRSDGVMGHRAGMGVEVDDLNGDGRVDFLSTHLHGEADALYLSQPDGRWRDSAESFGLGPEPSSSRWGGAFVDIDLDGDKDYIVVTGGQAPNDPGPILLWKQEHGSLSVQDTSTGWPWGEGRHGNYRGLAVADHDDDGYPEILVGTLHSWEETSRRPRLLDFGGHGSPAGTEGADGEDGAEAPRAGNWLRVALQATDGNRDAIGASVVVEAHGPDAALLLHDQRHGGGHYLGSNEERLLFGLGTATGGTIRVTWPGGATSRADFAANSQVHLVEPNLRPPPPVGWVRLGPGGLVEWEASLVTDFAAYRLEWPGGGSNITDRTITSATIDGSARDVTVTVIDTSGGASTPAGSHPTSSHDTPFASMAILLLLLVAGVAGQRQGRRR